jgi:hypothetical protein
MKVLIQKAKLSQQDHKGHKENPYPKLKTFLKFAT